jgi:hypothetical protein
MSPSCGSRQRVSATAGTVLRTAVLAILGLTLWAQGGEAHAPAPMVVGAAPPALFGDTLQIRIVPQRLELPAGGEGRLQVEAVGPEGAVPLEGAFVWYSRSQEVASVNPSGQVQARSAGITQVTVVAGGQVALAMVEVLPPPASRLDVNLPVDALPAGTSAPLRVRGWDDTDGPVALTELRFSSSDPQVARVDPDGRVHGVSPGEVRVETRSGEAAAFLTVQVTDGSDLELMLAPEQASARTGDVLRFELRSQHGDGGTETRLYPAWTVDRPGASIEEEGGEGVFVAEEPGLYRVTAVLGEAVVRSAFIEVAPRERPAALELRGRGILDGHHSGDMWVFEGADGRDYVYIGTFQHDWMKVFDVTDPSRPILTDSLWMDARRINDVKVSRDGRVAVATREGASDRRNGIVILDTSEPASPRIFSEYTETVSGGVHNVWIEGDLVYACHNGTSDLHIIDISDPENPREVGRWGLDRERKTLHDAIVQDGYAYLSYWDDGLVMLDVGAGTHGGTPTEPAFVSRFSYPAGHTHTAWRHGRYLFVGDEIFPMDWDPNGPIEARGYIHVLDMVDPENPVEVARYEVPEAGVHNFWPEGDLLYVGYYQAGIRVVDISGELRGDLYRQGRELAALRTTDEHTMAPNWPMTWGAQPFKGHLFSSDLNSGLWITRLELGPQVVF